MKQQGELSNQTIRPGNKNSIMEAKYLHSGDVLLACMERKVKAELQEPNLSYVLAYADHMKESKDNKTIARHLRELRLILSLLQKDAKQAIESDLKAVVKAINQSTKAPISKKKHLLTLRVFWRWLYNTDENPAMLKFIKEAIPKKASAEKTKAQMLTHNEIKCMVESTIGPNALLEAAVVMFCAGTGCRVGELVNCRISDLKLAPDAKSPSYIEFNGKTSYREAMIFQFAVPFVRKYIEEERKSAKPNEPLFIYKGKALDYPNVRYILKKLAARAGIQHKVHSHLYRYFLSVEMAEKGTHPVVMSKQCGYSVAIGAKYAATADHRKVLAKLNGFDSGDDAAPNLLLPKICNVCKLQNEFSAKLCSKCHNELGDSVHEQLQKVQGNYNKLQQAVSALMEALGPDIQQKVKGLPGWPKS